jgi:hypothetical protein
MRVTTLLAAVALVLASCRRPPPGGEPSPPPAPPPPPPPGVRVVDMIPASLSGETWQDAEPFLTIFATNPNLLAASAFTPNPGGPASTTAPIYVSEDGGNTWSLRNTLPSNAQTADITHAPGESPALYATILSTPSIALKDLETNDVLSAAAMTQDATRPNVDQPFVRAIRAASTDRLYVGINDFAAPNGRTATVDVSLNGGTTFTSRRIESRNTLGQNGPSIRPAVAQNGTVYVAYFGWRSNSGDTITSDIVIARDDNGATTPTPFRDLRDPSDNQPGRLVATNRTIVFSNGPTLGQERIGSTLSLAVDATHSDTVYLAWADRTISGDAGDIQTVHVRRSTDRGATWSDDLRTLPNTTNPSLAVARDGTVGLLCQQLTGTGNASRWVNRFEQSRDGFATHKDLVLATAPANAPALQFLPYLGDYNMLLTRGTAFLGIFSAANTPDPANFPSGVVFQRRVNQATHQLLDGSGSPVAVSIDPFFFSVPVMP